jgi:hypothetical protein
MFKLRPLNARVKKYFVPHFLLIAVAALSTSAQTTAIISGRAIDETGRPIPNALVSLYTPPAAEAFELIMPGARTLAGGEFFLDSGSTGPSKGMKLFIEEPVPKGFWSPFNGPPFGNLSRLSPFRGTAIWLKPNQARLDLGNVRAGILYAKVVIDLTKAWNTERKPSFAELKEGKLSIRDASENIIYDGRIPESALDLVSSSLNLSLTKGNWIVELTVPGPQSLRSPRRVINVKNLSCLRVALTDKQVQRPCG